MESNRQEKSVAESEEKFRLLLVGVKDYDILLLDTSGIVTAWDRDLALYRAKTGGRNRVELATVQPDDQGGPS